MSTDHRSAGVSRVLDEMQDKLSLYSKMGTVQRQRRLSRQLWRTTGELPKMPPNRSARYAAQWSRVNLWGRALAPPIEQSIQFKILTLMRNCLIGSALQYFTDFCVLIHSCCTLFGWLPIDSWLSLACTLLQLGPPVETPQFVPASVLFDSDLTLSCWRTHHRWAYCWSSAS